MQYDLLIRGAEVYAPQELGICDIAIKDGRIAAIAPELDASAERVIDAHGLKAIPGVLETHAHMLLPFGGTQTMNDFYDGTRAGLYGGVTTLIDFADQDRGGSIFDAVEARTALAAKQCAADFSFHCTLTDINEETLQAIPVLIKHGFTSFKFYTAYSNLLVPYEDMERAFRVIAEHGAIATVHAENEEQINAAITRLKAAGKTDCRYFLESKPTDSEPSAVRTLIELARRTGVRLLIRHVSSAEGAALIEQAQKEGLEVYGETCPHYLYFDETVYEREHASDYIVNPPIRTAADRAGIWRVLSDGTKFTIGTDDCAFYLKQKRVSDKFYEIPGGMPGIETRLVLLHELGVRTGRISMRRLAEMTSYNPAQLYGLTGRKGQLTPGADADVVLLDTNCDYALTAAQLHEKTDYTPFEGVPLHVRVAYTVANGKVLVENGTDCAVPGAGRLLQRGLPKSLMKE